MPCFAKGRSHSGGFCPVQAIFSCRFFPAAGDHIVLTDMCSRNLNSFPGLPQGLKSRTSLRGRVPPFPRRQYCNHRAWTGTLLSRCFRRYSEHLPLVWHLPGMIPEPGLSGARYFRYEHSAPMPMRPAGVTANVLSEELPYLHGPTGNCLKSAPVIAGRLLSPPSCTPSM